MIEWITTQTEGAQIMMSVIICISIAVFFSKKYEVEND